MTTEANNLLRMITAATMENWNEEQPQIQSPMNGSESGSRNLKSQITLNNCDEWEISEWMGGMEESSSVSVSIEGVELVRKKDRRRFGDEKRWEQFSGNDESFQKKVKRSKAIEKGMGKEIAEQMRKDFRMMKGRRFDKSLAMYWGKEILTKRSVSKLAYQIIGKYGRKLMVNAYLLYEGLDEDYQFDDLSSREIFRMKLEEIEEENKKRRTLQALHKRK
ncbi:1549_t:CDS:1 [Paraglomus occultum]|uniref:1549_t:CDS:1 n=1 Tax=Paraglomus occultum TaxID=144539 RepID=A0A9N9GL03_9GLOM|nr:1549_t:CDS:1 [Paraglomus occultum]